MSRSKVSILSKYVMAIAILALLFSVAITSARYALESYGSSSIGIESFDVDVALYDEDGNQVSGDITLDDTTEDLSSYSKVYYLYINNNDKDTLYYKIEETTGNFCFKVDTDDTRYTTYGGSLESTTSTQLTLTLSVHPDITINKGETQSLSISLYAEYQHTEEYVSVEVIEPEVQEDENHPSADGWIGLTSSNISSTLNGAGNYYLSENISVTSTLTLASGSTLCLNGHTLTGTGLSPLISVTSGNVTIQDCIGGGSISGASRAVSVTSGATLTLEGKPTISNNSANVYLESGAYISLGELEEGASIGVTSASSITGSNSVQITSKETSTYKYENAIKYIHSDNSDYKVSSGHNGYLSLIGKDYLNVTFALEGTNGSTPNNTPTDSNFDGSYYIEGFDDSWSHVDGDYVCTEALSEYKNSTYSYDLYYDMGLSSTTRSINFVISPYKWDSSMGDFGLGPTTSLMDALTWSGSYSNFNIGASQAVYSNDSYSQWANWELDFGSEYSTIGSTLLGIGDLTIVLQLNYGSVTFNWGSVNNIVSGVYFIVDGEHIDLS